MVMPKDKSRKSDKSKPDKSAGRRWDDGAKPSKVKVDEQAAPLTTYYVLYCEEDDSHCVVAEADIICEPPVQLQDEVEFFFGRKKPYDGIVKAMSVDYDEMDRKAMELNSKTKPPREASFHEDQPRKTTVKFRANFSKVLGSKKQPVPEKPVVSEPSRKRSAPSDELPNSLDKAGSDKDKPVSVEGKSGEGTRGVTSSPISDISDDASGDSLTQEELDTLAKIAKKKKIKDVQELMALASKPNPANVVSLSTKEEVATSSSTLPNSATRPGHPKRNRVSTSTSSESEADSKSPTFEKSKVTKQGPPSGAVTKPALPSNPAQNKNSVKQYIQEVSPRYEKKKFEGTYYLWSEADFANNPDGIKQLHSKYKVFISSDDLKEVKKGGSATDVARRCLTRVFTEDATKACSVTGRPSAGKGKDNSVLRPPLDPLGVEAIYEFSKSRALKNRWREPTRSDVNKALADVLCEIRYTEALRQQETQAKEASDAIYSTD